MDRRQKILRHIDLSGLGLEIGPSYSPVAPKSEGYNVEVLDYLTAEEMRISYARYAGIDVSKIEHVDHVWRGQDYSDLVGGKARYDWIIASHVVEHTPCLVSFLKGCESILKSGGVLALAVPDRRYCFDYFRERTGLAKVIDTYHAKRTIHSPGTAAEYLLNVVSRDGRIVWGRGDGPAAPESFGFVHTLEDAKNFSGQILRDGTYLDYHNWVFTPRSFRLLMHDLHSLGYINLREVGWFDTEGCEFFIALSDGGGGMTQDRMSMVQASLAENQVAEPLPPAHAIAEGTSVFRRNFPGKSILRRARRLLCAAFSQ